MGAKRAIQIRIARIKLFFINIPFFESPEGIKFSLVYNIAYFSVLFQNRKSYSQGLAIYGLRLYAKAMAELKYIDGDATVPAGAGKKVIIHSCNDSGGWTKGFVESVSKRWPEPEKEYRAWVRKGVGFELGKIQIVKVQADITVINMLCQEKFGFGRKLNYPALIKCLVAVAEYYKNEEEKFSVHLPRIGKGLEGGNWILVESILKKVLVSAGINVYVYNWLMTTKHK